MSARMGILFMDDKKNKKIAKKTCKIVNYDYNNRVRQVSREMGQHKGEKKYDRESL